MSPRVSTLALAIGLFAVAFARCAASRRPLAPTPGARSDAASVTTDAHDPDAATVAAAAAPREPQPTVPPAPDVHLPAVARSTLPNGLELALLEYHALPVLHIRLDVRGAGTAADPHDRPGLAAFVGDMLKEGSRTRTSGQIADAVEFVGGRLSVVTQPDSTTVSLAVLAEHADTALAILGELIAEPTFPQTEIDKLRRREVDRLSQEHNDPVWISRQAFYREVYGTHPYAAFDATPESLAAIRRDEIVAFHRRTFVARAMTLTVVGDVQPANFRALVLRHLGRIVRGRAPASVFPVPAEGTARRIVIVHRPGAQSVIRIGNLSLRRTANDFVDFAVANQVLGGGPSSRLFTDLRERRSLTYGAYSRTTETVDIGTFQASASVRTAVTGEGLRAFIEHLDRIAHEPPPDNELDEARRFLTDSFPLTFSTPDDLGRLVSEMRTFGLPDGYWDSYRTRVRAVTAAQSLAAARTYIHPERAVIVVVGDSAAIENDVRAFGPVRVLDPNGRLLRELAARP